MYVFVARNIFPNQNIKLLTETYFWKCGYDETDKPIIDKFVKFSGSCFISLFIS